MGSVEQDEKLFLERGKRMSEKTDRRQIRTKQLLRKALMELFEEKGLESITVSELAERAGINRGTFYLHYYDVADLLEKTKSEMLGGLEEIMAKLNLLDMFDHANREKPYPVVVELIEYFGRHRDYFEVILGPRGVSAFPMILKELMKKHMYNKLSIYQPEEGHMLVPRDYFVAYVSSANIGIIQQWFLNGCNVPPRELAMMIMRMTKFGPLQSSGIKDKGEAHI
jgi:AcrR family transcriptional regulator